MHVGAVFTTTNFCMPRLCCPHQHWVFFGPTWQKILAMLLMCVLVYDHNEILSFHDWLNSFALKVFKIIG